MLLLFLCAAGCSHQAWYEGLRDARRQDCHERPPGEVRECLEQVDRVDYEQYRREREVGREEGGPARSAPAS